MEVTQSNTSPNKEDQKMATNSQDLSQQTGKLVDAAIYAALSAGVPPHLIPVTKIGVDLLIAATKNPTVKQQTREAYSWTASNVKDQYEKAKQKASQGISAAKEQIPWDKINQIATSVIIPPPASPIIPAVISLYQRATTLLPPTEENRNELRSKL